MKGAVVGFDFAPKGKLLKTEAVGKAGGPHAPWAVFRVDPEAGLRRPISRSRFK